MDSFEVHSNERVCRKSGRLGLEQVLTNPQGSTRLYVLHLVTRGPSGPPAV